MLLRIFNHFLGLCELVEKPLLFQNCPHIKFKYKQTVVTNFFFFQSEFDSIFCKQGCKENLEVDNTQ